MMSELIFRYATARDVEHCHHIESVAYEGDEAATKERIALRIDQYPQGFLIVELHGKIVGFINSGCATKVLMADEPFKELIGHDPEAPNVVIMSVAIDPEFQGQGHASALMDMFVSDMRERGKKTIHLTCRDHHVPLYEHLGYRYVKPSDSSHGGLAWHEMMMDL